MTRSGKFLIISFLRSESRSHLQNGIAIPRKPFARWMDFSSIQLGLRLLHHSIKLPTHYELNTFFFLFHKNCIFLKKKKTTQDFFNTGGYAADLKRKTGRKKFLQIPWQWVLLSGVCNWCPPTHLFLHYWKQKKITRVHYGTLYTLKHYAVESY